MVEVFERPMKSPKNRSMPLSTAMVRFADVADLIRSRAVSDEAMRDLCDDYQLARETLTRLKRQRPKRSVEISEYTVLVSELEDEIIRCLLGTDDRAGAERE